MPPRRGAARRHSSLSRFAMLCVALALALLAAAQAGAAATLPDEFLARIAEAGSGPGQVVGPTGIATNPVNGHVYVAESTTFEGTDNARVSEFTPWGGFVKAWGWGVADGAAEAQVCTSDCRRGTIGSGPGQFGSANGIAVDAAGNVYVFERDNLRFQKFSPAGDFLFMVGAGVDQGPNHPGDFCSAAFVAAGDTCGAGASGTADGQFSVENVPSINGKYIAVGPDGSVYVGDRGRIQQFEPDGSFKAAIPLPASGYEGEGAGNPGALAVDPVSGDLYFAFNREIVAGVSKQPDVYRLGPGGEVLDTLEVDIPESIATDSAGNVFVARGFPGAIGDPEVLEFGPDGAALIPLGAGFAAPPSSPSPSGAIRLLSVGTNSVGDVYVGGISGDRTVSYIDAYGPPPVSLEAPPQVPPTIGDEFATAVTATTATVKARINPHFWADTKLFVEYGREECATSACAQQPAAPGTLLSGKVVGSPLVSPPIELTGLEPGATYRYRFVSESGGGGPVVGPEMTFVTPPLQPDQPACPGNEEFRVGLAADLPDCRAYEMVSPVDKGGADIEALFNSADQRAALDQAADSGDALTYSAYRAFADPESAPYTSQYLSRRGAGGWATKSISPPRRGPSLYESLGLDVQFKAFTADLCQGVLLQDTDFSLAAGSVAGFPNLYRRDDCKGGYQALTTVKPTAVDPRDFFPEVQGMSADGSRVFFRAEGALASGSAKGKNQLYERNGSQLKLVCVRPNGTASKEHCSAGTPDAPDGRGSAVSHAISDDGSKVYWSESDFDAGRIFVRVGGAETVGVSAGIASFWTAAADGSRAIYSEGKQLFEFDLASKASTPIASGFQGLMGASEDASRLYLVSTEALAPGAAPEAENLYLFEPGSGFEYIGALSVLDVLGQLSPVSPRPPRHVAQVSPDGGSVVFMSRAASGLTGFDNTDALSGELDAEVYLFRAGANGGDGQLRCISCLGSEARPSGRSIKVREDLFESYWAAASLPAAASMLHAPRVISDDGTRLFFQSFDALSEADLNGRQDIYEWELSGAGNCTPSAPGFLAAVDGCLNLISSGTSEQDVRLVDSSPDGRDVFFATTAKLASQDPGLVDIYDARAGGGFPAAPPVPAECEGEGCQPATPAPVDSPPASLGFSGPENPPPLRCPKGKHRVNRKGTPVCVKNRKPKKRHSPNRKHGQAKRGGQHR